MKPLLLLLLLLLALTACSPKLAPTIAPAPSHDTLIAHHHTLDSVRITTDTRYRFGLTQCEQESQQNGCLSGETSQSAFGKPVLCDCLRSTPPKRVDTLVITNEITRYRIRHDTIRVVHCDSIPYAVEVPIEVEKPIPRFYKNCTLGFFLILLCIILYVFLRIYLRR